MQAHFKEINREIQSLENHFFIVEFLDCVGQLLKS